MEYRDLDLINEMRAFFDKYPKEVIKDKYIVVEYPDTPLELVLDYFDTKFEAYKYKNENSPKAKVIWGNAIRSLAEGASVLYDYEKIE